MNDTALCYHHKSLIAKKSHSKVQSNFSVFNLQKLENVWKLENIERMFFEADDAPEEPIKFGVKPTIPKEKGSDDEGEQFEGLSNKSNKEEPPANIYVVTRETKIEEVEEEKKDEEEKKEETAKAKLPSATPKGGTKVALQEEPKKETRKYFTTYKVEFGGQINLEDEDSLIFQTYIVAAEKKEKTGKKDKKDKDKKDKKEKIDKIAKDPTTALVMGALGGQLYNAGLN